MGIKISYITEFAYNNSNQSIIQMAPYEALYGRKHKSPMCWIELGERSPIGLEIVDQTSQQIEFIRVRSQISIFYKDFLFNSFIHTCRTREQVIEKTEQPEFHLPLAKSTLFCFLASDHEFCIQPSKIKCFLNFAIKNHETACNPIPLI